MANTLDNFDWLGNKLPEPKDDRIERLARENEKKSILLKMQKCKTLKDYQQLQKELEESIE
ncbi:MAG: hypothetical protein IJZ42_07070 [Lachnospiraceae bacterium]|nr:hypothetical protein [Lachnospiraceae bacterium]